MQEVKQAGAASRVEIQLQKIRVMLEYSGVKGVIRVEEVGLIMKASRTPLQLALALIVALGFYCSPAQAADTKVPKIQFAETSHDFGKSAPKQSLHHSFTFKNIGKATLIIEKVKAG